MKRVIKLKESELVDLVKKIINEDVSTKRPHDKMVADCLTEQGFKMADTWGKYDFFMIKTEMTQNGTMKIQYTVASQSDPTVFTTNVIINGKNQKTGSIQIGTSTTCKDIVSTAHGLINVVYGQK